MTESNLELIERLTREWNKEEMESMLEVMQKTKKKIYDNIEEHVTSKIDIHGDIKNLGQVELNIRLVQAGLRKLGIE